jgi:hypothetical protein
MPKSFDPMMSISVDSDEDKKFFYVNKKVLEMNPETNCDNDYSAKAILVISGSFSGNTNLLELANLIDSAYKVNLKKTRMLVGSILHETIVAEDMDLTHKEQTLNSVREFIENRKLKLDAIVTVLEESLEMSIFLAFLSAF